MSRIKICKILRILTVAFVLFPSISSEAVDFDRKNMENRIKSKRIDFIHIYNIYTFMSFVV